MKRALQTPVFHYAKSGALTTLDQSDDCMLQ